MLPRKSVFDICFLYERSLVTDRPSHILILHLPQVLKGQTCHSLDAGLDSDLASLDLCTTVMFSSCFGFRHYPKMSINEENRKVSWRRAGSASHHFALTAVQDIFFFIKSEQISLYDIAGKKLPEKKKLVAGSQIRNQYGSQHPATSKEVGTVKNNKKK